MSYLNKEQLTPTEPKTIDEIAMSEVDNYIEKVEGSIQPQTQSVQTSNVIGGNQQKEVKKIVLPIDESVMRYGLKSKPAVGVKWLAEWCLMMIKKYPGRVFYSPTNNL